MKKSIILTLFLFYSILTYSQLNSSFYFQTTNNPTFPINIVHMGKISIGTNTPQGNFTIYENGIPSFMLKNNYGKFQIGMANANYNYHSTSKQGTVVLRNLGTSIS